jgi:hypothetical protein
MSKFFRIAGFAAVIALAGFATSANAAVTLYNFTLDGVSNSPLPPEPPYWGYVTVDDHGGNTDLTFDVVLDKAVSFYFNDTNAANHNAFDFLVHGTNIAIASNITTGFISDGAGSYTAPSIIVTSDPTKFDWAIDCPSACAGGKVNGKISELKFDVTGTGLSLGSISNSTDYPHIPIYFAADISYQPVGGTVKTGNIGATFASAVPEPATWAMMLIGFGAVGFMMRGSRNKQDGALTAA